MFKHFVLASSAILATSVANIFDESQYLSDHIINRDVAVIGGGSSGTYGAIQLQNLGQTVVVVEKQAVLGGHTNTYTDSTTGATTDYGVQAYWNVSATRDFFAHFNIPIKNWEPESLDPVHVDFASGQQVSVPATNNYSNYGRQLNKYPYIMWSWDLPDPVPRDLLLPFRDFVRKYNLEDIVYGVFFNSQGLSNILDQLTVNVMKLFDKTYIEALQGGHVCSLHHTNHQIFDLAQKQLGADALVSSTIVLGKRPDPKDKQGKILLVVDTPGGRRLLRVSKVLVSMPPLLRNMQPLGLDRDESDLFSKWVYSGYYTMLVRNTGLPSRKRFINAINRPETYNVPTLPAAYQVTETNIPGLFYVWYAGPKERSEQAIKGDVLRTIKTLQASIGLAAGNAPEPEFVEFQDHSPFRVETTAEAIDDGFYRKLAAIQGYRNTWYTGGAIIAQSSGVLWNFTNSLVSEMAKH